MKRFGLLGRDIKNSYSPKLHKMIREQYNLDLDYEILECKEEELSHYINLLKENSYHGFNVTKPFKEKIIPLLDELTPRAKKIQAVNTVYYQNNRLIGDNTDYHGFMGLLYYYGINVKDKHVYILGNGGASKAVYQVLLDLHAFPIVVYRLDTKKKLYTDSAITYENFNPALADLIIHTTSERNKNVLTQDIKNNTVIDLNYYPAVTPIINDAKDGHNGLIMLYIQALESQSVWFNKELKFNSNNYLKFKENYNELLRK